MECEKRAQIELVYMTAPTKIEARTIAHALVASKLAACVNIFEEVEALYNWEGDVKTEKESVMLVKTGMGLSRKITEFVKKEHSYECPCIMVMHPTDGNKDFFEWVTKITKVTEVISDHRLT